MSDLRRRYFQKLLILIVLWLLPHRAEAEDQAVDPLHTKALVVGVLNWQSRDFSSFKSKNRQDMQFCLQLRKNGVPEEQITYLSDKDATLSAIKSALRKVLSSCDSDDTFIFYYAGHGWLDESRRGYFANYDADNENRRCLSLDDIVESVCTSFRGRQVIFFADCCRSGALIDSLAKCKIPYAAFCSAAAGSTGHWTFTSAVVDTLDGHAFADNNKDGQISFNELSAYIKSEMRILEGQSAVIGFGSGFDMDRGVAKVAYLGEAIPVRVEVKNTGQWRKARLLTKQGDQGLIRWLEIGMDGPQADTWVHLSKVRALDVNSAGVSDGSLAALKFVVGERVLVFSGGEYYRAKILRSAAGRYLVRYSGYDGCEDEWVDADQIQARNRSRI